MTYGLVPATELVSVTAFHEAWAALFIGPGSFFFYNGVEAFLPFCLTPG